MFPSLRPIPGNRERMDRRYVPVQSLGYGVDLGSTAVSGDCNRPCESGRSCFIVRLLGVLYTENR